MGRETVHVMKCGCEFSEELNPAGELVPRVDLCDEHNALDIYAKPETKELWKQITDLKARSHEYHQQWSVWQRKAEAAEVARDLAEKLLNEVIEAIKKEMIWKPADDWHWGFRTGLLRILNAIRPPDDKELDRIIRIEQLVKEQEAKSNAAQSTL